jgi:hypothetical protein
MLRTLFEGSAYFLAFTTFAIAVIVTVTAISSLIVG